MTSQDDNAKRWQFSLRWLFFVTAAVASGAWSWLLLYRPDPDAPLSSWDLKRSLSIEVFNCSLIGAGVFGILLICNLLIKRLRPRFSVSTLVVVVTLVCCYLACWGPTKTRGVDDVESLVGEPVYLYDDVWEFVSEEEILDTSARLPLLVRITTDERPHPVHRYCFWFFGYVAKLPYERDNLITDPFESRPDAT